MTGYGAVRRGADLRFGETVAVVATGGVGSNICQIANAFGARQVIAIDVDDEKLEAVKKFGATAVVNSVKQNAREEVLKLTDGKGVDVAFEALGIPCHLGHRHGRTGRRRSRGSDRPGCRPPDR